MSSTAFEIVGEHRFRFANVLESTPPCSNVQLEASFRRNITKGLLVQSSSNFSVVESNSSLTSLLTNVNTAVGKYSCPSSPLTELPGEVFAGFLTTDEFEQFEPLATFQSLVNYMIKQRHNEVQAELSVELETARQLSRECYNSVQKKLPKKTECIIVRNALDAAREAFNNILRLEASKTTENVSEAYLTQVMEAMGPLSSNPNPQSYIYSKEHIQPLVAELPLHFEAEKTFHVFPSDTFLERFSTLFLLKSYEIGQKYAVVPLPDGNIKVLVRFLGSFFRVERENFGQKRAFEALLFTQNAMQFIQSDEFREFYNSVSVKICLIDENCIVQRNPGKECEKQHEMYEFGPEKMEWLEVQEKQLHSEQSLIMDENYQIELFIVDMLAIEKRDEVEAALNKAKDAVRVTDFDICIIYHLDHFARRRGAQKLPEYVARLKIDVLSELNFTNSIDVVQTLLCDEIRLIQRTDRFNEQCRQYIKNVVYSATQEIIQKSLSQVEFVESEIAISGIYAEMFRDAQKGVVLYQIESILQQELRKPHISYLSNCLDQLHGLSGDIAKLLDGCTQIRTQHNEQLANCLKQDLDVLCTRSLLSFLRVRPTIVYHSDALECNLDSAVRQFERVQRLFCGDEFDVERLNRGLFVQMTDQNECTDIDLAQLHALCDHVFTESKGKTIPRSVLLSLDKSLMLTFAEFSLACGNGQELWRQAVLRASATRTFRQSCCKMDMFIKKLRFDQYQWPVIKSYAEIQAENTSLRPTATPCNQFSVPASFSTKISLQNAIFVALSSQKANLRKFQFINAFKLSTKRDMVNFAKARNEQFFMATDEAVTFPYQFIDRLYGIRTGNLTLRLRSQLMAITKLPTPLCPPKHPLFEALDRILGLFERKFFSTEHLLNQLLRVKNNLQQTRMCHTIVILCDPAEVEFVESYIYRNFCIIYKQFRFKVISDCLEVIAFEPIQVIVLPSQGQQRFVEELREMVFKQNIKVYVLHFNGVEFTPSIADLPKEDLRISACRLIPANEYLESRIAAHLSEQHSSENLIETMLEEQLDGCASSLRAKYLIMKAVAQNIMEENVAARMPTLREQFRSINTRLFIYAMERLPQVGYGNYLQVPDTEFSEHRFFVPMYQALLCRSDAFLQEPRVHHLNYFYIEKIGGELFEHMLTASANQRWFIHVLSENTRIVYTRPVQQDNNLQISVHTEILLDERPERRMFVPRCCLMQDVSEFVFELVQSSNRCVGHVNQIKFNTQDIMYSDEIIHYMDSLHLYGVAHIDLKSISLSMQYAREEFFEPAQRAVVPESANTLTPPKMALPGAAQLPTVIPSLANIQIPLPRVTMQQEIGSVLAAPPPHTGTNEQSVCSSVAQRIIQNVNTQLTNEQVSQVELFATCQQLATRFVRHYETLFYSQSKKESVAKTALLSPSHEEIVEQIDTDKFDQFIAECKRDNSQRLYEHIFSAYTENQATPLIADLLQMGTPFGLACAINLFSETGDLLRPRQTEQLCIREAELTFRNECEPEQQDLQDGEFFHGEPCNIHAWQIRPPKYEFTVDDVLFDIL